MNIPDKFIDTIIRALRISINKSYEDNDYEQEVKYDYCLLKIQSLKRLDDVLEDVIKKHEIKAIPLKKDNY